MFGGILWSDNRQLCLLRAFKENTVSEKANETVDDFIKLCVSGLSREYAEALAGRAYFTTIEWLRVYDHCQSDWSKSERCFNMQVIAMKKAVATAKTLADWIAIAGRKGKHRDLAMHKVLQYEPTEADIPLFRKSGSDTLWKVGWYLAGRLEYKRKNPAS